MFKNLIKSPAARRRTSLVIAAVLIFPFVLFFHATFQPPKQGPGGNAGMVFGNTIPWEMFREQETVIRQRLESQMNGQLPEELMGPMVAQATWDRLIVMAEAARKRIHVADEEVAAAIRAIPQFQQEGRFAPERYQTILRATGMSLQNFEARLRTDLMVDKLVESIKTSVAVTDDEVKAAYRQEHEQLTASLLLIDPASFSERASAAITDIEVRAHYDAHPEEVRLPARVTLEYAGRSREEVAEAIQLDDEELRAFYEDHPDAFAAEDKTPKPFEEVRDAVRRQAVDERARKELKTLALDLQDDLDAQLRFEEIIAVRGLPSREAGPLAVDNPWAPGAPEPAVFQAATGLPEGQMSEVIESERGVHIARVTHRIPPRVPPFDEVRERVKATVVQQRARELAQQSADALRARLTQQQTDGIRFEETILLDDVSPLHPAPFTRTQPIDPLGAAAAVNEAAFAATLGELTEVLETPRGFVILRPEERIPADESAFAASAEALRQELLARKQSDRLDAWLKELRTQAKVQSFLDEQSL